MAAVDGGKIVLFFSEDDGTTYKIVGCLTDVGESHSVEERDTTCKNAEGVKSYEPGAQETEISFEGRFVDTDANSYTYDDLYGLMKAKTKVKIKVGALAGTDVSKVYTGDGHIYSLERSSPNTGEDVTYSGSVKISGEYTPAAHS